MRSILPLFAAAFLITAPALATEFVSVPNFRSVELRGGGSVRIVPGPAERVTITQGSSQYTHIRVEGDGQLRIDTCSYTCPHNYQLQVEIQTPRAPGLAIEGGGRIVTAPGFQPQPSLDVAVNGGGNIDARSIDARRVNAAVNGGGNIFVRPQDALSAAVNGGGHIRYDGNPTTAVAIRGGGDVSRSH